MKCLRWTGLALLMSASAIFAAEPKMDTMTRHIRHELVMLPYYGVFDNLAFQLNGREVRLVGQVRLPSLKQDAERAVRSVEGVESVVNELEVLPTSPNDDRIRLRVYKAIYGDSALNRYALQAVPSIHIIVKNGNVTLVGVAARQADISIAGIRANGVSGVFSVTNQLTVEEK